MSNKERVLVFGANSYIASSFIEKYQDTYEFIQVSRQKKKQHIFFDFLKEDELNLMIDQLPNNISAVLFAQGINPSVGAENMSVEHFMKMMKVNIITPSLLVRGLKNKVASSTSFIFFSSISKLKGSYDPAYAAAKSATDGLLFSLAKAYPKWRFNQLSLGLVENSPVHREMTDDFIERHTSHMHNNELVNVDNVLSMLSEMIRNKNMHLADIKLDGGYV
ncbi:SDR family oxidoreductase [Catalinimonas niigatensis]|uniref:SDR family oxidoreductase n=1 Tax=Catalinimonas niigatensis TaxID=1397264 RepID=UPI0026661E3A|nr:SDR family oxidoreductase [Catalinimonas niigatensis]WPP52630.1 SDR family oxidoreductase [Catalinimonas niigatensis]